VLDKQAWNNGAIAVFILERIISEVIARREIAEAAFKEVRAKCPNKVVVNEKILPAPFPFRPRLDYYGCWSCLSKEEWAERTNFIKDLCVIPWQILLLLSDTIEDYA